MKIIGTCGSGKSTFWVSMILSMATFYSPYEINFAILDMKNASYNTHVDSLPHTTIYTNDHNDIDVFFDFLKIEADRRINCFKNTNVPNIYEYNNKCKKEKSNTLIPRLIAIIDEIDKVNILDYDSEYIYCLDNIMRYWSLGIHIIIVSQGLILDKLNFMQFFNYTIIFKLPNNMSAQVLDYPIDTNSLIRGYCYMKNTHNNQLIKLQTGNFCIKNEHDSLSQANELINHICDYCNQ